MEDGELRASKKKRLEKKKRRKKEWKMKEINKG